MGSLYKKFCLYFFVFWVVGFQAVMASIKNIELVQLSKVIATDFQLGEAGWYHIIDLIRRGNCMILFYKEWIWHDEKVKFASYQSKTYVYVPVFNILPFGLKTASSLNKPLAITAAGHCFHLDFHQYSFMVWTPLPNRYLAVHNLRQNIITFVRPENEIDYLLSIQDHGDDNVIPVSDETGQLTDAIPVDAIPDDANTSQIFAISQSSLSRKKGLNRGRRKIKEITLADYMTTLPATEKRASCKRQEASNDHKDFMTDCSGGKLTLGYLAAQSAVTSTNVDQKKKGKDLKKKHYKPFNADSIFAGSKRLSLVEGQHGRRQTQRRHWKPRDSSSAKYLGCHASVAQIDTRYVAEETIGKVGKVGKEVASAVTAVKPDDFSQQKMSEGQHQERTVTTRQSRRCKRKGHNTKSAAAPEPGATSITLRPRNRPSMELSPGEWFLSDYRALAICNVLYDWSGLVDSLDASMRKFQAMVPGEGLDGIGFKKLVALKALRNLECFCNAHMYTVYTPSYRRLYVTARETDEILLSHIHSAFRSESFSRIAVALSIANLLAVNLYPGISSKISFFEKTQLGFSALELSFFWKDRWRIKFKNDVVGNDQKSHIAVSFFNKAIDSTVKLIEVLDDCYSSMENINRYPWIHACWAVEFSGVDYYQLEYEIFPEFDFESFFKQYMYDSRKIFCCSRNYFVALGSLLPAVIKDHHYKWSYFQLLKLIVASHALNTKIIVLLNEVSPSVVISFDCGKFDFFEIDEPLVQDFLHNDCIPTEIRKLDKEIIFLASPDFMHFRRVYDASILKAAKNAF